MINELKMKSIYGMFVKDDVFGLLPVTDQRLHASFNRGYTTEQSDVKIVYLFSGIGFVILLLAIINYVNMVTASSLKRAKEIGLRKVIGAHKSQLVLYQLVESIAITTIALVIAFAITERLLPLMNGMLGKSMQLNYLSLEFLLFVPIMGLLIGVLTGLYPSFYISRHKPLILLKKNLGGTSGKGGLRRGLVGFQFLMAGVLILVTLIMQSQMKFLKEQKMGFDKELLVYVPLFEDLKGKSQVFKNEVLGMSGVSSATVTDWMFENNAHSGVFAGYFDGDTQERPPYVSVYPVAADEGIIKTLGLKLLEAEEGFDMAQMDSTGIVISRLVADGLGWKEQSAIGKYVYEYAGEKKRVVAVIDDFHTSSLKNEILPSVIQHKESWLNENLLIRFETEGHQATLDEIKVKYESLLNRPFEFSYVDDEIEKYYKEEADQVALFNVFSGLAIFISLLGLMAMATYSAEQRKKEVSIRKVLGASMRQLILLLNKENGILVIIAFLIATPIAIYAMQDWLAEFKYRITLNPMLFVLAIAGFFVLNVLVTLFFSLKVSRANPADTLREE
jgi:putative ABC transport system permease protein